MSDQISSLIERLERATEGSHELDLDVWNAVSKEHWIFIDEDRETITTHRYGPKAVGNPVCSLDQFTRSLDSAMTLVPEGWFCFSGPHSPNGGVYESGPYRFDCLVGKWDGHAPTIALALVIASLRARQSVSAVK